MALGLGLLAALAPGAAGAQVPLPPEMAEIADLPVSAAGGLDAVGGYERQETGVGHSYPATQ